MSFLIFQWLQIIIPIITFCIGINLFGKVSKNILLMAPKIYVTTLTINIYVTSIVSYFPSININLFYEIYSF